MTAPQAPPERRDRWARGVRAAGLLLAIVGALGGAVVALGAWGVGYCGGLTPDVPPAESLRHDLCRGASGDATSGGVFLAWSVAAFAPLLGMYWALRRRRIWPLAAGTLVAAIPVVTIAILAEALPQS